MADLSYYDILGVPNNATNDQIRTAYKQMSKSLHPDKNRFGAQLMKQVNQAYETLSNPTMRREYDRNREPKGQSSPSGSPPKQKQRTADPPEQIAHFLCMICNDIVEKNFWESSCCARLCCNSCLRNGVSRRVCPNVSCQTPIDWIAFGDSGPSGWTKSSKFIQKQIDLVAPTHLCGRNILPENLSVHLLVCPKLNTQCFMCSGDGKYMTATGQEAQCMSCRGRKYLPGLDWTKCFKCKGLGIFMSNMGLLNCYTCNRKGALKGVWTMCFKCEGVGACNVCQNKASLKGHWTRCFRCEGNGGDDCLCNAKGALQGKWTKCFKCYGVGWVNTDRGARNNCDACHAKGGISGYEIQPCQLCKGCGCNGCSWKGSETCKCGSSCKGHSL